jgi:hypothetical protein
LDEAVRNLMQAATLPLDRLQAMPYAVISIDEFETAAGVTSAAGISAAASFGICAVANFPFGSRQASGSGAQAVWS